MNIDSPPGTHPVEAKPRSRVSFTEISARELSITVGVVFSDRARARRVCSLINQLSGSKCAIPAAKAESLPGRDLFLLFTDLAKSHRVSAKSKAITMGHVSSYLTDRECAEYIMTHLERYRRGSLDDREDSHLIRWLRQITKTPFQGRFNAKSTRKKWHRIAVVGRDSEFLEDIYSELSRRGEFEMVNLLESPRLCLSITQYNPEMIIYQLGIFEELAKLGLSFGAIKKHEQLAGVPMLYIVNSVSSGIVPFGSLNRSKDRAVVSRNAEPRDVAKMIARECLACQPN